MMMLMMLRLVLFLSGIGIVLLSVLGAMTSGHVVHDAMWLVLTLLGSAVCWIALYLLELEY